MMAADLRASHASRRMTGPAPCCSTSSSRQEHKQLAAPARTDKSKGSSRQAPRGGVRAPRGQGGVLATS